MAIIIKTDNPQALLDAIKRAVDRDDVVAWEYDEGDDFTHASDQYGEKAWLRPKIDEGELRFGILGRNESSLSDIEYGVYHGRFIEMLLTHFDKRFSTVLATATKTEPDKFN